MEGQAHQILSFNKTIDEKRQGEAYVAEPKNGSNGRSFYLESYGCQMNFSDSEIVASILLEKGFRPVKEHLEADLVLINTCAIRDNAEQRVRNRLKEFSVIKKKNPGALVGIMGCMAERLKEQLLVEEKLVDIVIGPDAYRELPALIEEAETGQKAVNVLLSREETYADVNPVRLTGNGVSAFITIMRGCDNMCSFCVVPFTRGRERSRDPHSIVAEARQLFEQGYREVTLLGQNVDSYQWSERYASKKEITKAIAAGKVQQQEPILDLDPRAEEYTSDKESTNPLPFGEGWGGALGETCSFAELLERVAQINPLLRVRFSTSNPRDMTDDVLHVIARNENICNMVHLPVQSGSSRMLEKMNRGHDREFYLERIRAIREIIPDCGITTDIITGFCSETEEDHQETMSLMEQVGYDWAFMFYYSERPGTLAARKYPDDVPLDVKKRRLQEVIQLQQRLSLESNQRDVGKVFKILVEGVSKKSDEQMFGRNSQNKVVVFGRESAGRESRVNTKNGTGEAARGELKVGEYVEVRVRGCTSATLMGEVVV